MLSAVWTAQQSKRNSAQWIGRDEEGRSHDQFQFTTPYLFEWGTTNIRTACAITEIQPGDLRKTKLRGTDRQRDAMRRRMTQFRFTQGQPSTLRTMSVCQCTEVRQLFKMQIELGMVSFQQWTPLETQIESNMGILCNEMRRNADYMNISTGVVEGVGVLPYFSASTLSNIIFYLL